MKEELNTPATVSNKATLRSGWKGFHSFMVVGGHFLQQFFRCKNNHNLLCLIYLLQAAKGMLPPGNSTIAIEQSAYNHWIQIKVLHACLCKRPPQQVRRTALEFIEYPIWRPNFAGPTWYPCFILNMCQKLRVFLACKPQCFTGWEHFQAIVIVPCN